MAEGKTTRGLELTQQQAAEIVAHALHDGQDQYAKKLKEGDKFMKIRQAEREMNRKAWLEEHPGKTEADMPNF